MDADRIMSKLNPAVVWILRSPLHGLLSRGLMLLTVTGRRTGRRYTIPVGYQRHGDLITVLISKARRKNWWRNYLEPRPVELRVRGRALHGEACCVAAHAPEFREAVERTFRRLPYLGGQFGISYDRKSGLTDKQWNTVADAAAMVQIRSQAD